LFGNIFNCDEGYGLGAERIRCEMEDCRRSPYTIKSAGRHGSTVELTTPPDPSGNYLYKLN